MQCSKPFFTAVIVATIGAAAASAAPVDFKDPRRALGREGNVRIDAELAQDTVSSNSPLNVTYQIENLTNSTIAIADKVSEAAFDIDSRTITISIGAEVPSGPNMPHLVTVNPGEKRVLSGGAVLHFNVPSMRTPWTAVPKYVQIKVCVLRDVTPFVNLIERQNRTPAPVPLPNDMFDRWVESSDSVLLNTIPVYWKGESRRGTAESDQPSAGMD
jgi:hypothetical protein